jgi:hypothetical protein
MILRRVVQKLPLSIQVYYAQKSVDDLVGEVDTISRDGAFLATTLRLPLGIFCRFELRLNCGEIIASGVCKVVSVVAGSEPGICIKFQSLDDAGSYRLLERFEPGMPWEEGIEKASA